jgi:hypothetical protein
MPNPKLLTANDVATVDRFMSNPNEIDAAMTVWQLVDRKTQLWSDVARELRPHPRFSRLPDEQLRIIAMTGETSGDGIFAPECLRAGICRRFAFDSPVELALRLSIAARYQWLQTQWSGNDHLDELWRPLLQAVAAHDFAIADRILDLSPPFIETPNSRAYAAVFAALYALRRKDADVLRQAVTQSKKGKPKAYVKAINVVLESALESSSSLFAEGMNKMLSAYPKYMYGDEIYGLVDPHAIGIYEICRLYHCCEHLRSGFCGGKPSVADDAIDRRVAAFRILSVWMRTRRFRVSRFSPQLGPLTMQ